MSEELKKFLKFFLISLLLLSLGVGGYILIKTQTQERLSQLEKEARIVEEEAGPSLPKRSPVVIAEQPEAVQQSEFYLKTESGKESFQLGENFGLQVMVKSPEEVIDGVEFILTYDSEKVTLNQVQEGDFFKLYPQKKINSEQGEVRVIALQDPDKQEKLEEAVVVTLKGETTGQGEISFAFKPGKAHIAGYGGQELLNQAFPLTLTID